MRLRCPHCGQLGTIVTTKTLAPTVSQHYVRCNNIECGHTWRATTAADMTLSPSATPNPTVALPLSSHVRRDVLQHQIQSAPEIEFDPAHTPPATRDLFTPSGADGPS
jgi:hypothetical protein